MAVRWLLLVTVFLFFVADMGTPYSEWAAPFAWAHYVLFEPLPYKIRLFDHIVALCWLLSKRGADGKAPSVVPVRNALLLAAATVAVWFAYGVLRGGDARAASWQTYLMLSGILFAFSVASVFRTPQHYVMFAKMLLLAAAYRATMCWAYYILYIRTMQVVPPPDFLTSHDDSVLWVVAMLILVMHMIETKSFLKRLRSFAFFSFLAGAVLWNQRRLAWVSLAMGILVVILLIPAGRNKRRVMRTVYALAPVFVIYAAVGWGRPERIFKPLQSLATVSTQEDTSTKARNVENLGLIATSNANNPLVGTGWGQPYVEVSNMYTIAAYFPLWQYIPHNSVLGLLAYTGILGFCGYWLIFPTAMFMNARMARLGTTPLVRQIGVLGAAQLVVCANQFYGDMGIYFVKSIYLMSLSYGMALRLPVVAGVWSSAGEPRRKPAVPKQSLDARSA